MHYSSHIIHVLEGRGVKVFGSNNRVNTSAGWDPRWECFVDGISIGATEPFPFFENNWALCEKRSLDDGPHRLTVDVTSTTGKEFWFDYVRYEPSASVSEDTAYIFVDNHDSAIVYGSGWGPLGTVANMTTRLGSELRFNFTGM